MYIYIYTYIYIYIHIDRYTLNIHIHILGASGVFWGLCLWRLMALRGRPIAESTEDSRRPCYTALHRNITTKPSHP